MKRRFEVIGDLVEKHGLKHGVEIGCSKGNFLRGLLNRCKKVHLTSIDPWVAIPGEEYEHYPHEENYERARQRSESYFGRSVLIRDTSANAVGLFDDESLDFVFIDGAHTYEGCKLDIELWTPKVKIGGFVTGHDYRADLFPGVIKAVDEIFPDAEKADESVWIVQRS